MKPQENSSYPESFGSLPLKESLLTNLELLEFHTMTAIQQQSLGLMLTGADLIARANTGSGKTAAFGLSLLNNLTADKFTVQALILCPTRELAEQVSQTLRRLARLMPNIKILNLSGGAPMRPQTDSLKHGAHIVVGTPGRIQKHLDNQTLSLQHLKTLVLDEADKMLDMGFFDAIQAIIAICPSKRQTLLFSATYPPQIKKIAQEFMKNPAEIQIETEALQDQAIEQYFFELATQTDKLPLLKQLMMFHKPLSTIIFCNTKQQTTDLAKALTRAGFSALALNGDLEQRDRDEVMIQFINQSCAILIATDVAARGIDIKKLSAVINFDLAFEPDTHIHRIGRTGRAGEKGLALSLTTAAEAHRVLAIEDRLASPIQWKNAESLTQTNMTISQPDMVTLCLNVGRKDKIRPGDILGSLTKEAGIESAMIGKIDITTLYSYVAIHKNVEDKVCQHFKNSKLKGRRIQARVL